jgi:hypothetical protein
MEGVKGCTMHAVSEWCTHTGTERARARGGQKSEGARDDEEGEEHEDEEEEEEAAERKQHTREGRGGEGKTKNTQERHMGTA